MYGIKTTGEDYPKKTLLFGKQDYQIAAVNALKAVDEEKDWKELYKPIDLNDAPQVHTDSDVLERQWDLWYETELRALAEAMFDMDEKDFYNEDYTPINNMAMFDIQTEDFKENNEYMSNHKCHSTK